MYNVRVSERTYELSPPDLSGEPYTDRGSYGLDAEFISIHTTDRQSGFDVKKIDESYYRELDKIEPGETAHVIFVEYITGDTFGSHGVWDIAAVKKNPIKALALRDKIEANGDDWKDTNTHYPWNGYFETLNSVSIVSTMMQF